jgi:hypothetical protein
VTDQEINRAVAESVSASFGCSVVIEKDYCNSYDAIMPLVKALDGTLKMKFIHALGLDVLKICPLAGDVWMAQEYDCHQMLTATPRQLCEAYLAVGGADA